ncbi:MAG: cell division FtsZ family protein [Kiritimatiellae bacterium]|nr:cell division FtsZ family protein [Kiritimatiellia bacterium]
MDLTSLPALPKPCRIAIVGVGGGACAALRDLLDGWSRPPTVAAINTDATALRDCNIPLSLAIGQSSTGGLGAAGDPSTGALAAQADADSIRTILTGHDLLLLVASLGGGTGSGAAPVVAKIAREQGLLTLAYVTTPFSFEDSRRALVAEEAIQKLRATADTVIRLPNEALRELLPASTPLVDAFAFANRMMAAALRGLWALLSRDNILNLDFADLQALVEHSANECRFGYGEGTGPNRAADAVRTLLEGPLLERGRIVANAGSLLVNIVGDPSLTLAELNEIRTAIETVAMSNARIRFGAATLEDWTGPLAVTLLAAEPAPPAAPAVSPAAARSPSRRPPSDRLFDDADTAAPAPDLDTPTFIRLGIPIPS